MEIRFTPLPNVDPISIYTTATQGRSDFDLQRPPKVDQIFNLQRPPKVDQISIYTIHPR